ncbi:uncharacterized protein BJ212DRAFT_803802 [Suillus subaureus]|uniref:Uncharacterized protein n=1 Tax=Suillus subaureus TaxID=48587 RepID=A0A9P7EHZ8_9AGAM|nr:uncharacterized protein BJ212DRAFT_803802 [Suillus subaureus]KAG1822469.1 hypothetical protein BJ212DRAFT_803802 [Suillus subaureus]
MWIAEGFLMMAYLTEAQKGTFISYFWPIFNLGAVVGSVVAFGTNFHSTELGEQSWKRSLCRPL